MASLKVQEVVVHHAGPVLESKYCKFNLLLSVFLLQYLTIHISIHSISKDVTLVQVAVHALLKGVALLVLDRKSVAEVAPVTSVVRVVRVVRADLPKSLARKPLLENLIPCIITTR